MKAVLTRASDLNSGEDSRSYVELTGLESIRHLLMKFEEPIIIVFAQEKDAPAELEIMIYDDFIE